MNVSRKTNQDENSSRRKPAIEADDALETLTWDLGRAYYAYVGLAERILVDAGLSDVIRPGMGHILFALYEEDDRTVKEIAARSQLASSTLAGLLNRMEKVGLVERSRDACDARLVRVRLTSVGRKLEAKCHDMLRQVRAVSHAGIGEKNVPRIKALLRQLTSTFRKEEQRLAQTQSKPKV